MPALKDRPKAKAARNGQRTGFESEAMPLPIQSHHSRTVRLMTPDDTGFLERAIRAQTERNPVELGQAANMIAAGVMQYWICESEHGKTGIAVTFGQTAVLGLLYREGKSGLFGDLRLLSRTLAQQFRMRLVENISSQIAVRNRRAKTLTKLYRRMAGMMPEAVLLTARLQDMERANGINP